MTDSQSGERLITAVDRCGGAKYLWKGLRRWEDFEAAAIYFAQALRWRACELRGNTNCPMPEN
ncbi:MAG TPA: hypothetical protein PKD12_22235 [Nitrospira sp.]|nr:hypothetical protein [Nitrospira sp.]